MKATRAACLLAVLALSRASTPCERARDAAEQPHRVGSFAPRCDADGAFEPLQCSGSTGYCWCVDDLGRELAGTQAPPGRPRPLCAAASAVAACVPPRGRAMVLVGQDMGAVTNYSRDVGAHFSGVMAYTDLAAHITAETMLSVAYTVPLFFAIKSAMTGSSEVDGFIEFFLLF